MYCTYPNCNRRRYLPSDSDSSKAKCSSHKDPSEPKSLKERAYREMLEKQENTAPHTAIDAGGYRVIQGKYSPIGQHRIVMEAILGRRLIKGESVHHKNGLRHDNRPDNLELWVGPIRSGVRANDLKCPHCSKPYYIDPTSY